MANNCVSLNNAHGSSRNETSPDGGSWREFWEHRNKNGWPKKCICCGENPATLGGHVTIVGQGQKQYIVPMCPDCNNKPRAEFRNIDKSWLVPVVDDDK